MAPRPVSTYRLQIRAGFDLDAAAEVTGYLRDLGVDWAYLSPLLAATPGSDHGYDVVDVTRVDPHRGGPEGLERFARAARAAGLGILVDIVPNHMGISQPRANHPWWDVLRQGRASEFADWFDIDWEAGDGRVLVPVLGAPLDEVIANGEITIDPAPQGNALSGLVHYYDHVFPLAPASLHEIDRARLGDADVVRGVLGRQHYELAFWREEATRLNYRRFFAVTTLAGVRVEHPAVFDATHAEILRWLRDGLADGLRVDHPDGLADPGGYLERLDAAVRAVLPGEPYVLVEKILEHGETLPPWWATAGTTGYDALAEFGRVLIDREGVERLGALDARLRAESGVAAPAEWESLIAQTKRMIADTIQVPEIRRLVRELRQAQRPAALGGASDAELHGASDAELQDALAELLTAFPVYRSYLPAGRARLADAVATASASRPDLARLIHALQPVLADPAHEVARRFQQTTGPIMAKGVEDTAFYRYTRLGSLTEVGSDPSPHAFGESPHDDFFDAQALRHASWPHAMTTLSTHDTKRGEDVRARLDVLAEMPERWGELLDEVRGVASTGHGPFDALLYQAVVGAWVEAPDFAERLHAYAEKAAREAAERTGWWDPDEPFETRMHAVVDAATSGDAKPLVAQFVAEIAPYGWTNSLSQKLLQLTAPGVPDVYQGSELWELSLVDPDNRRPVDFAERARLLAEIDAGALPPIDGTGAAKLLVTSRALRARRDRRELFTRFTPLAAVGPASAHVVAFDRGGAITVATRLPVALERAGGWRGTALPVPPGRWRDELTGRIVEHPALLADLLATYPVALLTREV